jgi:hypothetical protein
MPFGLNSPGSLAARPEVDIQVPIDFQEINRQRLMGDFLGLYPTAPFPNFGEHASYSGGYDERNSDIMVKIAQYLAAHAK